MTEVIYSIGSYIIELKKINDCEPDYINIIPEFVLVLGVLFWLPILLIGNILIGNNFLADKCGIKVTLKHGNEVIKSRNCMISNNPNKDAVKVQKIVDEYTKYIKDKIESERVMTQRAKEYNEQCCNMFKDVVTKVKVQ